MPKKVDNFACGDPIWHGITLTDSAARQIRRLVDSDAKMLGLRLSVKQYGCVGWGYVVDKVISYSDRDIVYEHDGARLFVPRQAMPFLDGTKLDYVQEGLNYMFKFHNPKAKHACGCGYSFAI